ncbi:hypothetical protein ACFE04_020174 [Oxalis oulophora]
MSSFKNLQNNTILLSVLAYRIIDIQNVRMTLLAKVGGGRVMDELKGGSVVIVELSHVKWLNADFVRWVWTVWDYAGLPVPRLEFGFGSSAKALGSFSVEWRAQR